jgi:hypothetical protein
MRGINIWAGVASAAMLSVAVPRASQVTAALQPLAADPVLVGAGDIADCTTATDSATAALLDQIDGTVFAAGDNAYLLGSASDYANCYEPTWGRHKRRTRPVPGNHDYYSAGAAPYYAYFGTHAGPPGRGYYSYDLGAWHIIAVNSDEGTPTAVGSAQERWLRADLAANRTQCTLAYWHHPRFSSGQHQDDARMRDIWQALYDFGADVIITGHDHDYEEFSRQTADGVLDANGIRQFVVGTGGTTLRPFGVIQPNSATRNSDTHGVLRLTLHAASFDWTFVPIAGGTFTDTDSRACVGAAPPSLGGRGFALGSGTSGDEMVWTAGAAQTGYVVARFTDAGTTFLPAGSSLPAAATSYTDVTATPGQFSCYLLVPLGAAGVLGNSDALCSIRGSASGAAGPQQTGIQLNQSTMTTLAWTPPGGQTGYTVYTFPLNGAPASSFTLAAPLRRTMHDTGGVPTCYIVAAMSGAAIAGTSDVLCALPGNASLSTAGTMTLKQAARQPAIEQLLRSRHTPAAAEWLPLRRTLER